MIELGSMVKDRFTGFEGFVVARMEHHDGGVQYKILPKELKDGKIQEVVWMGSPQLVQTAPPETVAAFA